jgi:hypothetical protein
MLMVIIERLMLVWPFEGEVRVKIINNSSISGIIPPKKEKETSDSMGSEGSQIAQFEPVFGLLRKTACQILQKSRLKPTGKQSKRLLQSTHVKSEPDGERHVCALKGPASHNFKGGLTKAITPQGPGGLEFHNTAPHISQLSWIMDISSRLWCIRTFLHKKRGRSSQVFWQKRAIRSYQESWFLA